MQRAMRHVSANLLFAIVFFACGHTGFAQTYCRNQCGMLHHLCVDLVGTEDLLSPRRLPE
jgi:hypothetical protein